MLVNLFNYVPYLRSLSEKIDEFTLFVDEIKNNRVIDQVVFLIVQVLIGLVQGNNRGGKLSDKGEFNAAKKVHVK